MKLGAIHPLTGRQWQLDPRDGEAASPTDDPRHRPWPDLEIVVPFGRQVTDLTGAVVGPPVSPRVEGGYLVTDQLTKLELRDLVHDTVVPNVKAVWAAAPGGDSARLHVLGLDPFAWLTPHLDTAHFAFETPPRTCDQLFGWGADELLAAPVSFGEVEISPLDTAELTGAFRPPLTTRILRCRQFKLAFNDLAGEPLDIDRLILFVLVGQGRYHDWQPGVRYDGEPGDHVGSYDDFAPPLRLEAYAAPVPPGSSLNSVEVSSVGKHPLLVYAVRYRVAHRIRGIDINRTLLVPGHYRLTVEGNSKAVHPGGSLPPAEPLTWAHARDFWVGRPESLRPYFRHTTLGDSRLFLTQRNWDPTQFGVGFPAYRAYQPVLRFLVPYMDRIFNPLRVRVAFDDGTVVEQDLAPTSNPEGESALPTKSQDWLAVHGASAAADQELLLTTPLPRGGISHITVSTDIPGEGRVSLDEWTGSVSSFARFSDHVAWAGPSLVVLYGPAGKQVRPSCTQLHGGGGGGIDAPAIGGLSGHRFKLRTAKKPEPPLRKLVCSTSEPVAAGRERLSDALKGEISEFVGLLPEELSSPPASWALPPELNDLVGPLNPDTAVEFCRFALASGARFNSGGGERLVALGEPVAATTIEAVVANDERPLCLWLRTTEPLDWLRVSATLRIQHVEGSGPCPTALAHRHTLDLELDLLPSPDGSSAFLVGRQGGVRTRFPRGQFELSLRFDPSEAGLPRLHPTASVGPVPESVLLRFVQPFGQDWPLPHDTIHVPIDVFEKLAEAAGIDPGVIHSLLWRIKTLPDPPPDEQQRGWG